jgi:hypothetical protein
VIVVLTDPRRGEYLSATMSGVDQYAPTGERRVLVVDGVIAPDVQLGGWEVHLAPKPAHARAGENRWSTWAAFELAARAGENLVFLEDDVVGSPGAAARAVSIAVPSDCAFLMLYAPWGDVWFPGTIWRFPAGGFSYCQALKLPLRTLRELVLARGEMEAMSGAGSDDCIRVIGERLGWLVGVHYPGLYQHVGERSLAAPHMTLESRTSDAWAGPDFDVRTLDANKRYR